MSEALEVIEIGGESFRTERELLDVAPARIAELDACARHAAKEAVGCAVAAGRLLLAVRDRLPHGAFLAWCATECPSVSHRTATRYMQLAEAVAAQAAEQGSSAAVADDRSLVQLYRDYGIVKASGKWGGVREGAGRPAKDAAAAIEEAATLEPAMFAAATGALESVLKFQNEKLLFARLTDEHLTLVTQMLGHLAEAAGDALKARLAAKEAAQ